jgi:hypothetical protein
MTKTEARNLFGPAFADLARALDISRAAVHRWPEQLTPRQTDLVIGAAVRLHKPLPPDVVRTIACAALAHDTTATH